MKPVQCVETNGVKGNGWFTLKVKNDEVVTVCARLHSVGVQKLPSPCDHNGVCVTHCHACRNSMQGEGSLGRPDLVIDWTGTFQPSQQYVLTLDISIDSWVLTTLVWF